MSNDWDLSAIVRSCSSSAARKAIARNTLEESFFHPDEFAIDFSPSPFPVLIDPKNELDDPFDELSHVYKPFYGRVHPPAAAIVVSTLVAADSTIGGLENKRRRKEVQQRTNGAAPIVDAAAILINAQRQQQNQNYGFGSQEPRGRRRKQPRLVVKMNAEALSTDLWNWRKYGQKPIRGSITPRSYYRCSSFKGCAARKQVDLSEEEPDVYIVTYFSDHTHPLPGGSRSDVGSTANVSTSDNTLKPDSEDNNENSEPSCEAQEDEDEDDIVVAMHALD